MQLTPEDKLILASVKIQPTTEELEYLNDLIPKIQNWEYLLQTIVDRGIGPLLLKKIPQLSNKELIPSAVHGQLQQVYYRTLSRGMVLYDAFKKIAEAFHTNGLELIALKGIYLAENLYQDIALRQFSDIDLLIKPEDGAACLSVLKELGFVERKSQEISELIHSKSDFVHYKPLELNDVSVEIHIKLHRDSERYKVDLNRCWSDKKQVKIHGKDFYALSLCDLIIHLCIHLDKHFREGHVQFTCFNDITNVLEINSQIIDWELFLKRCQAFNCETDVMKYLILVHRYFNASIPDSVVDKYTMLLTDPEEQLFYQYLHGYKFQQESKTAIPTHLYNLKRISSLSDFSRYLKDVIFPPKSFMVEKYNIKIPALFIFYYPYRYYIGLKGLVYVIRKKAGGRKR
jgi:hypothetical protein